MISASVVGATGFTGAVLTDSLARHPRGPSPRAHLVLVRGSRSGSEVFPHLRVEAHYQAYDARRVARVGRRLRLLSARGGPSRWWPSWSMPGQGHRSECRFPAEGPRSVPGVVRVRASAAGPLGRAVYGLPELYRDEIAQARLGGQPRLLSHRHAAGDSAARRTSSDLAGVVVDAKSRCLGCGTHCHARRRISARCTTTSARTARWATGTRRRWCRSCRWRRGRRCRSRFTPHLLPVDRGILSTVYCRFAG